MQLSAFAKNARDVIKAGNLRWDLSLIRSEMTTDHRISDRRFLADMLPKGGIGAEIGVFTGLFSTVLLEIARPKKIYFVDPWWGELTAPTIPTGGATPTMEGYLRRRPTKLRYVEQPHTLGARWSMYRLIGRRHFCL